jgi:hypothetical protein
MNGGQRNIYGLLVREQEGKRPLGRSRHRQVENIKKDLVEIVWGGVYWVVLVQDKENWRARVNDVRNLFVL